MKWIKKLKASKKFEIDFLNFKNVFTNNKLDYNKDADACHDAH